MGCCFLCLSDIKMFCVSAQTFSSPSRSTISFLLNSWSVFDWGLKVSFGVFLLKHLWLSALWPKANNKALHSPWNNGDFFIKPLNTLLPSEGLKSFMSVITLYTEHVYTLSYNKVIIKRLLTAHREVKACRISTALPNVLLKYGGTNSMSIGFWFNVIVVSLAEWVTKPDNFNQKPAFREVQLHCSFSVIELCGISLSSEGKNSDWWRRNYSQSIITLARFNWCFASLQFNFLIYFRGPKG